MSLPSATFTQVLFVLEHQAWVTGSFLRRLWQLYQDAAMDIVHLFSDTGLATLPLPSPKALFAQKSQFAHGRVGGSFLIKFL